MSTEQELRLHRCCFTGHRPEKLTIPERKIKAALGKEIRAAFKDGYQTFITGMSRGVDLWAAEIVLRLRTEGLPIRLICASPYEGFESRWHKEWKELYRHVLSEADLVKFICQGYGPNCFQIRNQWMVNHSSRVIAAYDKNVGKSGTRNTIQYAAAQGVSVVYLVES